MYLSLCRPILSWKLTIFFYLLIEMKVKSHILQMNIWLSLKFVTFCVDCISNNWASKINVLFFLKYLSIDS